VGGGGAKQGKGTAAQPKPGSSQRDDDEEEEDEQDQAWSKTCKLISTLQDAGGVAAVGGRAGVMRLAYDECCALGHWAAAWRVLTGWCHSLSSSSTVPADADSALAVLGRMMFIWRQHNSSSSCASISDKMPTKATMLADASQAAQACTAALCTRAVAVSSTAETECTCSSHRHQLLQADAAARMTNELALAAAAANLWPVDAALFEATAELLGKAAELLAAQQRPDCNCSKGQASAPTDPAARAAMTAYVLSLQSSIEEKLSLAAAALLQAHDETPGDPSTTQQAKAVLRKLREVQPQQGGDQVADDGEHQQQQLFRLKLELLAAIHEASNCKQRRLLTALAQHPAARAEDALQAARALLVQRPWRSEPAAMLALGFALRLAAERPGGQAAAVAAEAAQRLLRLSTSQSVRGRVIDRVADVLEHPAINGGDDGSSTTTIADAPSSYFPRQQLSWLVACCWNWAVEAKQAGDGEAAGAYNACWRRLAVHLPGVSIGKEAAMLVEEARADGGSQGSGKEEDQQSDDEESADAAGAPCGDDHEEQVEEAQERVPDS